MRILAAIVVATTLAVTTIVTAAFILQKQDDGPTYRAAQITASLCYSGYVLIYPDDPKAADKLYCVKQRKGLKLVDPEKRFSLSGMTGVCPPPGKPALVGGALTCIDPTGTCHIPGTLPRVNEEGKLECHDFLLTDFF